MENKPYNPAKRNNEGSDNGYNANSAYSGSGTMQPGGGTGQAGGLGDSLDDLPQIEGFYTEEDSCPHFRSVKEATDPSKLDKF